MSGRVLVDMPPAPSTAFGPDDFAAAATVSRETLGRLKRYAELLADWNTRHNLVSVRYIVEVLKCQFLYS
jgi:16S rRNA G527 N7-methylase RsmG